MESEIVEQERKTGKKGICLILQVQLQNSTQKWIILKETPVIVSSGKVSTELTYNQNITITISHKHHTQGVKEFETMVALEQTTNDRREGTYAHQQLK
jgi:hypothetical protein